LGTYLRPKPRLFYDKLGLLCKCVPKPGLGNENEARASLQVRSQAGAWERERKRNFFSFPGPAWERICSFFLVPKPLLGNVSAPEAPVILREARASLQVRSQAGAWERERKRNFTVFSKAD